MHRTFREALLPLIAFMIVSSAAFAAEPFDAGDYLKKNVVQKRLKNGITVILLNRGYAPVLAFEIAFRAGSSDESYRTTGTAHLLEHMLFKGTDRIGTTNYAAEKKLLARIEAVGETIDRLKLSNPANGEIPALEAELHRLEKEAQAYVVASPYDRIYTENGGVGFNASTSKDMTGYYIELPASKLELWADLESERLRNPVFREFYLERNNVVQERLMSADSKGTGLLFEQFIAAAFAAHPYRHPVIGWRSSIPFLSLGETMKFYRTHYIPSRMTICIVGKQDTDRTLAVIERAFGGLEPMPDPPYVSITEGVQTGERRVEVDFASAPYLVIGWHKPAYPDRDDILCEAAASMLADGKSSRLYRSLVLDRKIASSVAAWNGAPGGRYPNLVTLFVTPRAPHTTEEVERAVYEEMDAFFRNVTEEELRRVINKEESSTVFELGSNKGLASILSYYSAVHGDWRQVMNYMDVLRGVTLEEIRTLGPKYFTKNNRTVGVLRDSRAPKGGKK